MDFETRIPALTCQRLSLYLPPGWTVRFDSTYNQYTAMHKDYKENGVLIAGSSSNLVERVTDFLRSTPK